MFSVDEKVFFRNPGCCEAIIDAKHDDGTYTIHFLLSNGHPGSPFTSGLTGGRYPVSELVKHDYHERIAAAGHIHDSRSCPVCQRERRK